VKYAFIQDALSEYSISAACSTLEVSRSGYYAWLDRPASARTLRRQTLAVKIRAAHVAGRFVYGSPRVHAQLLADSAAAGDQDNSQGCPESAVCCVNTVARVMREQGIRAKARRAFVPRTTDSAHQKRIAGNLLDRKFTAKRPDQKWVVDITYIATNQGWLYVAGVLDLCSRKLVGWSMAQHMETDLIADALKMAIVRRSPGAGLLHHSDHGVQYASDAYQHLLEIHGMKVSMSGKGDCWDNACMESFWSTLKTELVHHESYATREAARASIFEYIEVFYNRVRLHSSLGYVSPETFEAALN
jgi:putative transposase